MKSCLRALMWCYSKSTRAKVSGAKEKSERMPHMSMNLLQGNVCGLMS